MMEEKLKLELDRIITEKIIKNKTDKPRERLLRACVAYWENEPTPVKGVDRKTNEAWSMEKKDYIAAWDKTLKIIRKNIKSDYGLTAQKGFGNVEIRSVCKLPRDLLSLMEGVLQAFENNTNLIEEGRPLSMDKERDWFFKNFPRYRIANKI